MFKDKSYGVKENRKDSVLTIEYVEGLSIKPNQYNPNTHSARSFDLLLRSIALFGFTQPIIAHRQTREIIDGEHRWRASCVLGIEKVPVCFIDLTEEEMRIATLMHNEARGKHSKKLRDKMGKFLETKGIELDQEMLKSRENTKIVCLKQ